MFESLITQLDEMGIEYTEGDTDLTIDIADMEKADVIDLVNVLKDSGYEYTISESEVVVQGNEEEVVADEEAMAEETSDDAMAEALNQYAGY